MYNPLLNIKKKFSSNVMAVIDIGDIRTFCLVYRVYDNDNYKLLSIESILTNGFEKGVVVDLKKASDCLSKLLKTSEKVAKSRIIDVIVSSPRDKTTVFTYPFVKSINREVTIQDLEKLIDNNEYSSTLSQDEMLISVKHADIFLDGKKVDNPIGMYVGQLTTEITIIKCFEPYIVNLLNLFDYLSINLVAIIHPSLAFPYLLDINSLDLGLFIHIGANTTNVSISNKSKIVYYKEIDNGVNNILNEAFQNLGISYGILEEKEIYNMSFADFKDKVLKFTSNGKEINVPFVNINNELDKVITSFFNLIMIELKGININNIINVSIIGECSNLIRLNTMFSKQMSSNTMLINKLKDENIVLDKPLESVSALSIIKYYLKHYKTDSTLKVLSKKLKDLLY